MWHPTRKSLKIVAWVWATPCWLLTSQNVSLLRPPRPQTPSQTIIAARRQTWIVRRVRMAIAVVQRPPTVIQTAAEISAAATRMAILTMTTTPIWKVFVKVLRPEAPQSTLGEFYVILLSITGGNCMINMKIKKQNAFAFSCFVEIRVMIA